MPDTGHQLGRGQGMDPHCQWGERQELDKEDLLVGLGTFTGRAGAGHCAPVTGQTAGVARKGRQKPGWVGAP